MSDNKVFVDGMIVKAPHQNAPDFVKLAISIKCRELLDFMKEHQKDGWLNIDVKESKGGKLYAELNTFKPTQGESAKHGMQQAKAAAEPAPAVDDFNDNIPF